MEVSVGAYYVCAEAVTNTVKHAQATRVWISIVREGESLAVDVRDDGGGGASIDPDGDSTGLRGLRDRVEALAGTVRLESPAGEGTRLHAVFPLAGS